jgi:hypothetical protein
MHFHLDLRRNPGIATSRHISRGIIYFSPLSSFNEDIPSCTYLFNSALFIFFGGAHLRVQDAHYEFPYFSRPCLEYDLSFILSIAYVLV